MKSEILSERELRLFADQINLNSVGLSGQEKLKNARVLVIGAGGKGTAVLQNLALAGVGYLGISDNTLVDEAGIPKQRLYGDSDLGKQKAIISKEKLQQLAHFTEYEIHNICLSSTNILDIFRNYSLIVDATDNFLTHYLINDAAIILNKPVIFGSGFHGKGMVAVFNYAGGPSFRCLYPKVPHHQQNDEADGVYCSGILYSLTGSIMANEALAIILDRPVKLSGQMLTFNCSDYTIETQSIIRNANNFNITQIE